MWYKFTRNTIIEIQLKNPDSLKLIFRCTRNKVDKTIMSSVRTAINLHTKKTHFETTYIYMVFDRMLSTEIKYKIIYYRLIRLAVIGDKLFVEFIKTNYIKLIS